jgi:peptidoglycan hydrolase-like protein with peptidoglycan-binding domain
VPARVPIGQSRPTRDRYQEIQQALADAGFFPHAIDGIWGKQSEAALKKYQQDQGLNPTGRLDSLTLIRWAWARSIKLPKANPPPTRLSRFGIPSSPKFLPKPVAAGLPFP